MPIRVVHIYSSIGINAVRVPIHHPHILGNPFSFRIYGREDGIQRFSDHLKKHIAAETPEFINEFTRMAACINAGYILELACFCAPERCHGEVIAEELIRRMEAKS